MILFKPHKNTYKSWGGRVVCASGSKPSVSSSTPSSPIIYDAYTSLIKKIKKQVIILSKSRFFQILSKNCTVKHTVWRSKQLPFFQYSQDNKAEKWQNIGVNLELAWVWSKHAPTLFLTDLLKILNTRLDSV